LASEKIQQGTGDELSPSVHHNVREIFFPPKNIKEEQNANLGEGIYLTKNIWLKKANYKMSMSFFLQSKRN